MPDMRPRSPIRVGKSMHFVYGGSSSSNSVRPVSDVARAEPAGEEKKPQRSQVLASVSDPHSVSSSICSSGSLCIWPQNEDTFRWHNGCFKKYCTAEGCKNPRCKFLHDLNAEEAESFTEKNKDIHCVFRNDASSSEKHSSESTSSERLVTKRQSDRNLVDWSVVENRGVQPDASLGNLPSRGSDKHATGNCKPCMFARLEDCAEGANCRFCHFPHVNPKIKIRQCKGKRESFKKLASRLLQRIDEDPDWFNPETVEMPASVSRNLVLRTKLISLMTERADRVRADRAACSSEPHASGSAVGPAPNAIEDLCPRKISL